MKSTDLIKELTNAGCVLKRVRGSHHMFYSPITKKRFQFLIQNRIYRLAQ